MTKVVVDLRRKVTFWVPALLMLANVGFAAELKLVGEAPVGEYYADGSYETGANANEIVMGIWFVPTSGTPDRTLFVYKVNQTEQTCACTERRDYDADNRLINQQRYERLQTVPLAKVDSITNALKLISRD